jgi:hypothetical protein
MPTPNLKDIAADPARFREKVMELYRLEHHDWTDWELDWFEAMLRRSHSYKHSEKEQAKLIELDGFSATCTAYDGRSVHELIDLGYCFRLDLHESDQDFLVNLREKWRANFLRIRQLRRLVHLLEDMGELEKDAA